MINPTNNPLYTAATEAGITITHLGASWAFEATLGHFEALFRRAAEYWVEPGITTDPASPVLVRWSAGRWYLDAQTTDGYQQTTYTSLYDEQIRHLIDQLATR
ncbi:MAG TPA: hypothetical protein DCZ72_11030 [Armatimonadetes bacterium]|nr:hypothetical protein [Armatimonadota bacterium]